MPDANEEPWRTSYTGKHQIKNKSSMLSLHLFSSCYCSCCTGIRNPWQLLHYLIFKIETTVCDNSCVSEYILARAVYIVKKKKSIRGIYATNPSTDFLSSTLLDIVCKCPSIIFSFLSLSPPMWATVDVQYKNKLMELWLPIWRLSHFQLKYKNKQTLLHPKAFFSQISATEDKLSNLSLRSSRSDDGRFHAHHATCLC